MSFLPSDHRRLPANSFVVNEAVQWVLTTFQEDVSQEEAVELLQVQWVTGDRYGDPSLSNIQPFPCLLPQKLILNK